jgi:probable HAF family extracellular repeat protein
LGASCSVGSLIISFGTAVTGTPSAIGFIPVQSGTQSGFKLITNFANGPAVGNSFGHLLQFAYTVQGAPNFEISAMNLAMDATAQGSPQDTAFAEIGDFQNFQNAGFVSTDTVLDVENGAVVNNLLTDNEILPVPSLLSDGNTSFAPLSTELSEFATGSASVSLNSATFLFTVAPQVAAPRLAPVSYTNIDLPNIPTTEASGINNDGQIVGAYIDAQGIQHGYVTGKRGGFTTIDFPGATATNCLGINNRGDITGFYDDLNGNQHGFTLINGTFSAIDFPNSLSIFPFGINDKDQVVGEYQSEDGAAHGFLLDNGQFTTIDQGRLKGVFGATLANGINNHGDIAGLFFDPDTLRGFVENSNVFQIFDIPGQGFTEAEGINDAADVVGSYDDTNLVQHGFLRTNGKFFTVDFPGGNSPFVSGINASGKMVGGYADDAGKFHSFLAIPTSDDGQQIQPISNASHAISLPVCGSPEWQKRLQHRHNTAACKISH